MITQGKRRNPFDKFSVRKQPGSYWPTNDGWRGTTPNGLIANLSAHEVTEHDDCTITVSPSILVTTGDDGLRWHGYLEHGVWREVP